MADSEESVTFEDVVKSFERFLVDDYAYADCNYPKETILKCAKALEIIKSRPHVVKRLVYGVDRYAKTIEDLELNAFLLRDLGGRKLFEKEIARGIEQSLSYRKTILRQFSKVAMFEEGETDVLMSALIGGILEIRRKNNVVD